MSKKVAISPLAVSALVLVAIFYLFIPLVASAQDCGRSYSRRDRHAIRAIYAEASAMITRMHDLAITSNELDLTPGTQRAAMDAEYQALMEGITYLGDNTEARRRRTREFLDRVIDAEFLQLTGSLVDGEDTAEATTNAYSAARTTISGLHRLWHCV